MSKESCRQEARRWLSQAQADLRAAREAIEAAEAVVGEARRQMGP
jgi:hypothetical protein